MLIDDIKNGESPTIEFKRDIPEQAQKYLKTVSAFANCLGGRIVFGVDADLSLVGMSDPFVARDRIADAIANGIEPMVVPDISLQTVEGKTLIVVEIAQGPRCPYWVKALGKETGTFIRYDATTRAADADVIRELSYDGGDRGFDEAHCRSLELTTRSVDQLCVRMRRKALSLCESQAQRKAIHSLNQDKLEEWGILTKRSGRLVATNAFALLSGDKALSTVVKCGIFKGIEHKMMLDRREFGGPIQDQIESSYEWLLSKLNMAAVIRGVYRQDVYEFPEEALRELITNAVMHRNYAVYGSDIQIALYDDRLEIISPGGLPRGMTLERMKEGCSRCRNKAIASAFAYMKVAEKWGLGVPNVMQSFADRGLAGPEYVDWGNAIKVVLRRKMADTGVEKRNIEGEKRNIEDENRNIEGENRNIEGLKQILAGYSSPTVANALKAYQALCSQACFSRKDLVDKAKLSVSSANRLLSALTEHSLIEPVSGHGKGAYRWIK